MNSTRCPAPTELSKFAVGNLAGPDFARLAAHVQECATCEAALQQWDAEADPLLAGLRGATDSAQATAPAIPRDLLNAARAVGSESRPDRGDATTAGIRRLGKFELLEELGLGSFGHVFRAHDTQLDRTVAIKVMRAGRLASREEIDRFLREARSAAQLKHPGIVALYDSGQTEDGACYLVEEYVQGQTLASHLEDRRYNFRDAAEVMVQVATALDYAHRHGVIHRDIKPSNILVDPEGRPHLMDFGLAKRDAEETPMTLDGEVLGTPAYMSPEQAQGRAHQVDARSDIYSLGVVLYELLTGERPFRGNRRMLLLQVLQDEPRPPRSLNDKVPRDLETICLKAIAKTPARRYATAQELADDLRRWRNGEPILARPVGRTERLWRWCRRNPVAVGLFLAVTIGSAAGLWHLYSLSEELVKSAALESAAQQSQMVEVVNELYSERVVDRVTDVKGVATDDYRKHKGAIPLPATFTIELGQHLSERARKNWKEGESATGTHMRLYSDHPFPRRVRSGEGGPKDDFERVAVQQLSAVPDQPFYRFEDYQGRPSLRYATAQRLKATCLKCHNDKNGDSPKKDWKENEVGGVLEIIRPLDSDVKRAREGLRGTFILMAVIAGSLLGLSVLFLVLGNRQQRPGIGHDSPS